MADLGRGGGWKLHLEVDEENQDVIEALIEGMGIGLDTETSDGPMYKRGRASGQSGKDFTVYVGHKDDAMLVAEMLNEQAGDLIKATPGSDASKTDVPMAGNVLGRFDVGKGGPTVTTVGDLGFETTDLKYNQYGGKGFPHLNKDVGASLWDKDYDRAAADQRAQRELTKDYGEAYTGSQSPTQFPEAAPAMSEAGSGGGGVGDAPPPAASFGGGAGGGFKFDRRKIFEVVDEAVMETAEEVKNMAQIEAPYVTGFLHDSHEVVKFAPASYGVFATAFYAKDVHEGHSIKNRKGGESFGKTTGNPWMERAIKNLAVE